MDYGPNGEPMASPIDGQCAWSGETDHAPEECEECAALDDYYDVINRLEPEPQEDDRYDLINKEEA